MAEAPDLLIGIDSGTSVVKAVAFDLGGRQVAAASVLNRYDTAADGAATQRLAEPLRLVPLWRRWYLVAYDLHRHDWRSFRLDRIAEAHRTGARFRPRELPEADAVEFVRAGMRAVPTTHRVEALVHAPAAAVRLSVGRWAEVTEEGPDRCVLRMTVDDLAWPAMALGATGVSFEVRSPPALADLLRDWGERFARAAAQDRSA